MNEYVNKKTGAVINSSFVITGCNWVLKSDLKKEVKEEKEELPKEEVKEESKTTDEPTREMIMQELDSLGIEYNKKAKKSELLSLLD